MTYGNQFKGCCVWYMPIDVFDRKVDLASLEVTKVFIRRALELQQSESRLQASFNDSDIGAMG
jgi:hypothetical protein